MEANELRIGNITDKGTVKSFYENGIHVGMGKTHSFSELNPIPLTEQWLLDFGFEKPAHSFICERYHLTKQDSSDYWFLAFNANNAMINKLKYVHQIQNIHFALTGEELTKK